MVNFFIVGAQRTGTTYLYNHLQKHPSICMLGPLRPEPKYFLQPLSKIDKSKYLKQFNNKKPSKALGEKSTTYIESEQTALKIKKLFPDGKIIICLRDPVERALSNYFFSYNSGVETRTLEEVFLKDIKPPVVDLSKFSANPFSYIERGQYCHYIKKYRDVFPEDQVMITFMENFTNDDNEMTNIFEYLNIPQLQFKLSTNKINSIPRDVIINPDILSKLKQYYIEDAQKLIQAHNLTIPYAHT